LAHTKNGGITAGKGELDAKIVATVMQDLEGAMLAAKPMSAA
jgi:hypothetical protein